MFALCFAHPVVVSSRGWLGAAVLPRASRSTSLSRHVQRDLRPQRRARRVCVTVSRAEPPVKSSFYKNPSKAIEKGGGFYIPGLRGPRLRLFVGVVAAALLALNASGDVSDFITGQSLDLPLSYFVSCSMGVIAATVVLSSAYSDLQIENGGPDTQQETPSPTGPSQSVSQSMSNLASRDRKGPSVPKSDAVGDDASWASSVLRDMLPGRGGLWVFRTTDNDELELECAFRDNDAVDVSSTLDTDVAVSAGPVVERVAKELRTLYVDKASTLPEGITFPFLDPSDDWSVLVDPLDGDTRHVVVVARAVDGNSSDVFSASNRRWAQFFARRVVTGLALS